jgi:hypothetical protein
MQVTDSAQEELFDLVLMDEASQMDVAHAILPFCAMAAESRLVLAGDDKQLGPIQKAEPPEGLEDMVGSIYNYFADRHGITPEKLNINYRSSKEIVDFCRHAGYDEEFRARHPDLKLGLTEPLPDSEPTGWPKNLIWQPEWNAILRSDRPVGGFLYDDTVSGQSNPFEADSIAGASLVAFRPLS